MARIEIRAAIGGWQNARRRAGRLRYVLLLVGISTLFGMLATNPAPALGALPQYGGLLLFPEIHGPADPEEYSWEVKLQEGETLKLVDETSAEVDFEGIAIEVIDAAPAHDARGIAVPTTLNISEGDIVTLTVHHRAGNPAAGGASFVYPVSYGPAFEVGFSSVEVRTPEPQAQTNPDQGCLVPKLRDRTLKASMKRLREAGCKVGRVTRLKGATARASRVVAQNPKPGVARALGAIVAVTLSG